MADVRDGRCNVSTRIDYTAEEWAAISTAPEATRLFMGMAISKSRSGVANEPVAVGRDANAAAAADVPELIRAVLNGIRCGAGRPTLQNGLSNDGVKDVLLSTVKTAVSAVEHKSPVEVEAFKAWLACVAAKVSRTGRDQSPPVDGRNTGRELEGVQQLADVLAVGARQPRHLGALNFRAAGTAAASMRRSMASLPHRQ